MDGTSSAFVKLRYYFSLNWLVLNIFKASFYSMLMHSYNGNLREIVYLFVFFNLFPSGRPVEQVYEKSQKQGARCLREGLVRV